MSKRPEDICCLGAVGEVGGEIAAAAGGVGGGWSLNGGLRWCLLALLPRSKEQGKLCLACLFSEGWIGSLLPEV